MSPPRPREAARAAPGRAAARAVAFRGVGAPLSRLEREFIEATIESCGGSIPRAAKVLELSPSTIYRKIESWSEGQRRAGA